MNLEPIATLISGAGHGVEGSTLFITEMPASSKQGILLLDNYYGTQINQYLPGYYATEFRMIVRSPDRAAGAALAQAVSDTLTVRGDLALTAGMTVKQMLPMNLPRPYRRSIGGFFEFEVDIDIRFVQV